MESAAGTLRAAAVGAISGLAATVAMSAVMLAARRVGISPELPPARIAEEAVEAARGRPATADEVSVLAMLGHLGFGAAAGALYGVLARRVTSGPIGAALGTTFAAGVWLVSYQGWIPALGILPPASRDDPGRVTTMVAAHGVYGAVLGTVTAALRR